MARSLTQKAKRLRLEAAAERAKEEWHKKRAKAEMTKTPSTKKLHEADALLAEAKYKKLRRRLRPRRREKGVVEQFLDLF